MGKKRQIIGEGTVSEQNPWVPPQAEVDVDVVLTFVGTRVSKLGRRAAQSDAERESDALRREIYHAQRDALGLRSRRREDLVEPAPKKIRKRSGRGLEPLDLDPSLAAVAAFQDDISAAVESAEVKEPLPPLAELAEDGIAAVASAKFCARVEEGRAKTRTGKKAK